MIINLPKDLEGQTSHRYGPNSFKLHRMPMPRPGQVCALRALRCARAAAACVCVCVLRVCMRHGANARTQPHHPP